MAKLTGEDLAERQVIGSEYGSIPFRAYVATHVLAALAANPDYIIKARHPMLQAKEAVGLADALIKELTK
jgi:hypothetical protein